MSSYVHPAMQDTDDVEVVVRNVVEDNVRAGRLLHIPLSYVHFATFLPPNG
nr:hypothetical protein [Hwanghaeella grinnelliae]